MGTYKISTKFRKIGSCDTMYRIGTNNTLCLKLKYTYISVIHVLWKESLNSHGQQYHISIKKIKTYKRTFTSHFNSLSTKKRGITTHTALEIQ
jgi:hypothetical protein